MAPKLKKKKQVTASELEIAKPGEDNAFLIILNYSICFHVF